MRTRSDKVELVAVAALAALGVVCVIALGWAAISTVAAAGLPVTNILFYGATGFVLLWYGCYLVAKRLATKD